MEIASVCCATFMILCPEACDASFSAIFNTLCKEGLFALKRRLLYDANKASLRCKEALFEMCVKSQVFLT